MTPAQQRRKLKRIIAEWCDRLSLNHYIIEVAWDEEPDDEEALASVSVSDLYDHATLRFASGWWDYDDRMVNRIVVHELVHIMFRDFGQAVRSVSYTGALSGDVVRLWHDRCHDTEEALVDRLANRLVDLGGIVE